MNVRMAVRQVYVRDTVCPLLSRSAAGAVQLDLVLRALAWTAAEDAEHGIIDERLSWSDLHDLVRSGPYYAVDGALKRKWVSDKLRILEQHNLIRREQRRGDRSSIKVLRDDGSGRTLDDPSRVGDHYLALSREFLLAKQMENWRTPQTAAFLAAMIAERHARMDSSMHYLVRTRPVGTGVWSQSMAWFADLEGGRPAHHVRVPFADKTLRRGLTLLKAQNLIAPHWVSRNPRTGRTYENRRPRRLYVNGFGNPGSGRQTLDDRAKSVLLTLALRGERADASDPDE